MGRIGGQKPGLAAPPALAVHGPCARRDGEVGWSQQSGQWGCATPAAWPCQLLLEALPAEGPVEGLGHPSSLAKVGAVAWC